MSYWYFDIDATKCRFDKLSKFYTENGLNADDFCCTHHEDCQHSQKSDQLVSQFKGGTAAIMPYYDVYYKGIPIRVLIIGKENAYMRNKKFGTSDNFVDHTINVLNCINWDRKNNHIKGTLITLQELYQCDSEYVYSCYALTNLLRCSYQFKDKIENKSGVHDTTTMRYNCMEFLLNEIEILSPTIIVAQGSWSTHDKYGIVPMLEKKYGEADCIWSSSIKPYGLYKFDKMLCLVSHHPAIYGHWKKNLAPISIWPAFEFMRSNGYLPQIELNDSLMFEDLVKDEINKILLNNRRNNNDLREKGGITFGDNSNCKKIGR